MINKYYIIIFILFFSLVNSQEKKDENLQYLKTLKFINEGKDETKTKKQRTLSLIEAKKNIINIKDDSLKNKAYYKLSNTFLNIEDSLNFRNTNRKGILIAKETNDSTYLANHYWDLGWYYQRSKQNDSAFLFYDSSQKILKKTGRMSSAGRLLLRMAKIQKEVKDYTGSEITITDAIEVLEPIEDNRKLYSCYNDLGTIFKNLEEYEKSLEYHNKALYYLKKIKGDDRILKAYTLNNIGLVYRYKGKYKDAIDNFEQALSFDSLYIKNPRHYATLLDNLAYSKFLSNDISQLPELFLKSLDIRDSLKDESGLATSKRHLAEYYLEKKDSILSLKYVSEAKVSALESRNMKELLSSLLLSSKIDIEKSNYYLNKHIHISDSLVKHERAIRNKFARIRFETDRYISQNEKLSIQNTWIVAISTAIIFFGFLIYVITQQRTRNKELEMERQQQRTNEEIYNLMIDQQDKIEEGRKREKERISLELHDGILGRLFGTRLSLGSLNAKDDANSKKVREQYINELQGIEEEVRNISHELGLDNFDKTTSYSTMIANLLEEQSKITNFKYQIEDDDRIVWTDIPGHIKINIYRIIQESIQNINKYAQAENVILDFHKEANHIILTIKDDGIGFDQSKRSSGIGLKNMKSRVTLLHGQFTINSIPGKGTSISVDVPMT
ncbi:MAG: sensor histidine kinase [Kordia sp.]|uniref:ATP-binding protein n=1 Tax=Kordia sp. TaxID=1965332 RepID=UPI00385E6FB2